jgi:hypothetical protein
MIIILTPTPFFWQPVDRRKGNGSSRPGHTSFQIMENDRFSGKTRKRFRRGDFPLGPSFWCRL